MTNGNDVEIWLPIPDYEGVYEVSNLGRVRSWYMGGRKRNSPRIKDLQTTKFGYVMVVLSFKKRIKAWNVHRLVLSVFSGKNPKGLDCCHINGNKSDNRYINLKWGTRKDNEADKLLHGKRTVGMRNGQSKLNDRNVLDIRNRIGENRTQLAKEFQVSQQLISSIQNGKGWNHVH